MMKRQIILDTETTGLEPAKGHRIIEIGCMEMINRKITGDVYHIYINPERDIEYEAEEVHGITNAFLADKPKFADIADEFLRYINGADLVIHNAPFDVGFINHELKLLRRGFKPLTTYCTVTDTLAIARKKHPGQRNGLDALCQRYHVDNSNRQLHGALLDAELLAQVYLLLTGGQTQMFEVSTAEEGDTPIVEAIRRLPNERAPLKVILPTTAELEAHKNFMEKES